MRLLSMLLLALVACGNAKKEPSVVSTTLAAAVNEDGLAIVVCDTVVSYAPTSLVLRTNGWAIAEDAALAHTELLVKDASVCVHLQFDESQVIESLDAETAPTTDPWPVD